MTVLQGSLLDVAGEVRAGPLAGYVERRALARGAWVEVRRNWVSGADSLFEQLLGGVAWRSEQRWMYDRVLDVPRLVAFFDETTGFPLPVLDELRDALSAHYAAELGEPFVSAGLCCYRDGRDSVAWHGDTIGRGASEDTMVAIVSLGAPRRLSLRPRGGGASIGYGLGPGDLLVMGGSCQRTWEHAVLKTTRAIGARISVQFRPHGVR